jgi:CRISPR-associated endonuclease/helicase Cas3
LLDALIELLQALHCTVIILSATLNRDRREQLLNCKLVSDAYPLITAVPNAGSVAEVAIPAPAGQDVAVRLLELEQAALEEALDRAEGGQHVLWIENTVLEAQQRYLDMAARAADRGVACGLLHSRYTPNDRQALESLWVSRFGKAGWSNRADQGCILVGTQVLEQSLDIDADFMVSRFAPTDMLLQRLGRLWRHEHTPRPRAAVREAWILAPDLQYATGAPEKAFGNSAFVYSPFVLCRSLEVWQAMAKVQLPTDIRSLIERTYAIRDESAEMAGMLADLDNGTRWRTGRKAMRQLARITLADAGNTLPESKAQTRYSETDSFDVLLVRYIKLVPEDQETRITLLNGEQHSLPWQHQLYSKAQWRKLSATLMRQVVALRIQDAPLQVSLQNLERFRLQYCFYLGNPAHEEAILRVALVDETGRLSGLQGAPLHDKYSLDYRNDLGYRVIKP